MSQLPALNPETATGPVKPLFDGVQAKLGVIPNLFRVLGNSPAALNGYLGFSAALAGGSFPPKLREQIALVVAETNQCAYCLRAHAFLAGKVGLTAGQIAEARQAGATDPRTGATLQLARTIVVERGELGASGLDEARQAGLTDGDIVETVAHVALNIFSNYLNHIAGTAIDFPEIVSVQGRTPSACACG